MDSKTALKQHWESEPCGTRGVAAKHRREYFAEIERIRYRSEPFILDFAQFEDGRGRKVLEVGVGAGTDYVNWLRHGAKAVGIDLTVAAASLAHERAQLEGLKSEICVADAEQLPFADGSFDLVYAYGVLHHSPDTLKAIAELHRVLKPDGLPRVMLYHHPSVTGWLLWAMHCAARLRPWRSPRWAIARFLESPGTKAYTLSEAARLFSLFSQVKLQTRLGTGDLLAMEPSARYRHLIPRIIWALYPRWFVRLLGDKYGLGLLIEARKPTGSTTLS